MLNKKTILLVLLMFTAACAANQSGEVVPTETSSPTPLPAATTPTPPDIPKRLILTATPTLRPTSTPTSTPNAPLSAEGPWLLYLYNTPSLRYADVMPIPAEFILINQDGSGRTSITMPKCEDNLVSNLLINEGNSVNYLAQYDFRVYLLRPFQTAGMRVYPCHTSYHGNEKGGFLASFYEESDDVSPELILFELPSGEIRERFPLVRCSADTNICEDFRSNWFFMMWQRPQWSPDGRYLAFVALLDSASSDLFIYDKQNGNLRRLTSDPNWVGGIEWSPDGSRIIMQVLTDQEVLNDLEFFYSPDSKPPESVWSVTVSTNETKFLYAVDNGSFAGETIWFWLDDKRFIAYEGTLAGASAVTNLRLVDMQAGTNRILFDGYFRGSRYDPIHETFVLYSMYTQEYEQGIYLVSLSNGNIQYSDFRWSIRDWDESTGLFVSFEPCEDDPQGLQALDYQGNYHCIPNPNPTPTPAPLEPANYQAPNGEASVTVNDGVWLETDDEPAVLVSQETAAEVVWCPDSSCFFFSASQQNEKWALYHVSLPDLTIEMVDEGIESTGTYQWLGGE
jgi:WD40 repeat protein